MSWRAPSPLNLAISVPDRTADPGEAQVLVDTDPHGAVAASRVATVIDVGRQVPELELRDDRGRPWRLDADRDRPLLLILHRHFY